jgi:hypothetical protein
MPLLIWIATMALMLEMSGVRFAPALSDRDRSEKPAAPQAD